MQRVGDGWVGILEHEEVVQEGGDVEEDGFDVEEELGKEREVLRVELVICAVELVDGDVVVRVDAFSGRGGEARGTCFLDCFLVSRQVIDVGGGVGAYQVLQKRDKLFRVFEAPLTHVQPIDLLSDKLFRVAV